VTQGCPATEALGAVLYLDPWWDSLPEGKAEGKGDCGRAILEGDSVGGGVSKFRVSLSSYLGPMISALVHFEFFNIDSYFMGFENLVFGPFGRRTHQEFSKRTGVGPILASISGTARLATPVVVSGFLVSQCNIGPLQVFFNARFDVDDPWNPDADPVVI
jgi:hypothetical protein